MEDVVRILHLEDEPLDSELAQDFLERAGFKAELDRVETMADFEQSLRSGRHSLVISDYTIPGTDPLDALRLVRRVRPEMPFVFLSGTIGEERATGALKLGANDYVLKQRMEQLGPTIRRALKESEELKLRHQAEDALRRSEERLRLAQEVAQIGTFEWDLRTGGVQWSPEMALLHGMGHQDFQGTMDHWQRCIVNEDVVVFRQFVDSAVHAGHFEGEWRVRTDGGGARWLATRAYLFHDEQGEPVRIVGVNIDMTSRNNAEEALRSAKQSAEQAKEAAEEASRAKDRFIAILSHELRTPLTAVLPALDALESLVPGAGREYLEMASRNVELEARLIDDLLDITRIGRGVIQLHLEPMDVRDVLRRAVEVCQRDIADRNLHFQLDMDSKPHRMRGDPARIQQVLWNLIQNAVKFTPTGGCLLVRALQSDSHSIVEVHDSGAGIEREAMHRIFNAFEQEAKSVTRKYGGLGLGLSISKSLVEMHGGTITAASDGKDKGAVFTVRLPLAEAPEQQEQLREPSPRKLRALRILMVEDHPDAARILSLLLRKAGHDVDHASTLSGALEFGRDREYDLVLSDLGLPDGTGYDLMRQMTAWGKQVPAIALSGYGTADDILRSREAGFAEHMVKPIRFHALQETLTRVLTQASTSETQTGS